ncbi:UDP-glucose 4-epimerase GalE [Stenotrophomonas maltophilia]|uniref:UDP-glucose 4-epimerase GalE n=1 Tax=Stenotrophomonas maltophilia TaxID=40324 RepID=UPI000739650E|nr:UDP-glucose 4-epimerase GalE [Stenotrophomonas maltophilia]CRD61508.1 UDP-galactose-4-epimerase [Stenotrophomonas maltophilia]
MRVLVTGGTGYIGSHVCVRLLESGNEVIILDDFSNSDRNCGERIGRITGREPRIIEGDVRSAATLDAVFESSSPDAVIHFAALKSVGESARIPLEYHDVNVGGTISLLKAMKRHGCRKLVFSSSATVYGHAAHCPVAESSPVSASNTYGRTKLICEQIINDARAADSELQAINLRYFNPVGAHQSGLIGEAPHGIPNNLMPYISQVASGIRSQMYVYGGDYDTPDGTGVRDYIHVCDLADAHLRALQMLPDLGDLEALNLGTGRGHSVLEVIQAFSEASGRTIPYQIVARREGDAAQSWADTSLAHKRLDWIAQHGLRQMCEDAWRWQLVLDQSLDTTS